MATIITGTGSYIPNIVKTNKDFISNDKPVISLDNDNDKFLQCC